MAVGEGFEPSIIEPKAIVLPITLTDSIERCLELDGNYYRMRLRSNQVRNVTLS